MTARDLLLRTWHWNPMALFGIAFIVIGALLLTRTKTPQGKVVYPSARGGVPWRAGALVLFVLTQVSPLDTLANGYLFSAHMLQHLVLLLVVPAMVLLSLSRGASAGIPLLPTEIPLTPKEIPLTPALSQRERENPRLSAGESDVLRALRHPAVGWVAGVGAMWLWHTPSLCNAAGTSASIRAFQTISFLTLGTLFWWPIIGTCARSRLSPLAGVLYLFTACAGCTVLGILITFMPTSICPVFLHHPDPLNLLPLLRGRWGLTPQVDQQIGGLIMWVPACLIYFCGIMALLLRWQSGADLLTETGRAPQPQPAG